MKMFGVICLLGVGGASAFSVTETEPKEIRVKEGESFQVMCTVDGWYEVSQLLFKNKYTKL